MDVFVCEEKTESGEITGAHPYFGLILTDLEKISPNYESLVRSGQGRNLDTQFSSGNPVPMKGRGTKRKLPGEGQTATSGKKVKSDLVMPKLPPNGYPLEHPYNKDGYRYILAEPDPHAPFRQEFDDSTDWAGKPIPGWLYRKLQPSAVLLAMHDRAPQLKLSDDRLSVTGEKGYCMIRATHGLHQSHGFIQAQDQNASLNQFQSVLVAYSPASPLLDWGGIMEVAVAVPPTKPPPPLPPQPPRVVVRVKTTKGRTNWRSCTCCSWSYVSVRLPINRRRLRFFISSSVTSWFELELLQLNKLITLQQLLVLGAQPQQ
ncbi:set1/Ash2 histone methyltransferase complex subunit ASH2 [Ixodes scapularis]